MIKLGPDDRPRFKRVEVVDGYNHWASSYDCQDNPLIILEEPVTLELIGQVQGKRVLDLGCGTGRYCALLADREALVIGIDCSKKMMEQAKKNVSARSRIELHHGTIDRVDFPDQHFDLVVSALTLNHMPALEPTLREAVRVLKDSGMLIISDIHPFWPVSGHDYVEFFDETGQEYRIPEFPHLFEEYWRILIQLGMRIEEIREPRISDQLIVQIPSLEGYEGMPLAMVLKARKEQSGI